MELVIAGVCIALQVLRLLWVTWLERRQRQQFRALARAPEHHR